MNKKLMMIALLCVFVWISTASADLVGWWKFDEGAGIVAADSSGNGLDASIEGPIWTEGHSGSALEFNGTDSGVRIPEFTTGAVQTVAMWIKFETVQSGQKQIFNGNGPPHMNFELADGQIEGRVYTGTGNITLTGPEVPVGVWTHVAWVWDFTANRSELYIDGVSVALGEASNTLEHTSTSIIGRHPTATTASFLGIIDEVRVYNHALDLAEIQAAMKGNVALSSSPDPKNDAIDILRDHGLSWKPGEFAAEHNVYFGTSFDDVNSATVATASDLDVNSFDPGRLDFGKTYYWRVDEVNGTPDRTVFKGDVWSFTVEPYSIMVPVDVSNVTASSSTDVNPPSLTVDGSGLTGSTHSSESNDMWLSAATDLSPWLMVEFDQVQKLDKMLIWNSNSPSEGFIGWGIKDINVETSVDGVEWAGLSQSSQIARAPGSPNYDTPQAMDLGLALAKYVRINILSNWGGLLKQYGVSEIQFFALPVYVRTPDPASGSVDVLPNTTVAWRAGREADQHTVYVSDDANAVADGSTSSGSSNTNRIDLSPFDLELGKTYYWRVDEVNEAEILSVWQGPVWSLSTVPYVTIDDFESYTNFSPNRPFQTWLDGYGYSADEFFSVTYPGNGTGAGIGHDIWAPSSPYFDSKIMETTMTLPGSSQSMPFYYSNSGAVSSQTERTFASPQDWTLGGIKTLSIPFFGQPGNTGTLYVKIDNTKVTYPYDPTHIATDAWQAWNIDLSSLNVQSVTKLQIGVDGPNASGMILIDDIRLYPASGELLTPTPPAGDNLVGAWSFDEGSGTVAVDSSGHDHNGTIVNGTWETGPVGSALHFDGVSSQVTIPAAAWNTIDQQATVSFWAYVDSAIVQSPVAFAAYQNPTNGQSRVMSTHIVWSNGNLYFDSGGDATNYDRISKAAPASVYGDAWIHWAFTKNADTGEQKIYRNGMLWHSGTGLTRPMTGVTTFTLGAHNDANFWNGSMDEFQLYNRELTHEEILWLAGMTGPMDKLFE